MLIAASNNLAGATFVPAFGSQSALELRRFVKKGDVVSIFSFQGMNPGFIAAGGKNQPEEFHFSCASKYFKR